MRRRAEAGFTLMEILIALGIFVLAASSLMGLFMLATATHRRAIDATQVAMLAESVLADLEGDVRAGRVLAPVKGKKHPNYPGLVYDVVVERVHPADKLEARVEVVVRWKREGKEREKRFPTVMLAETAR